MHSTYFPKTLIFTLQNLELHFQRLRLYLLSMEGFPTIYSFFFLAIFSFNLPVLWWNIFFKKLRFIYHFLFTASMKLLTDETKCWFWCLYEWMTISLGVECILEMFRSSLRPTGAFDRNTHASIFWNRIGKNLM